MSERISISQNLHILHRGAVLPHHVVDLAVFHLFHDTQMVGDERIAAAGKESHTRFSAVTRFRYSIRMQIHTIFETFHILLE